MLLKRQLAEQEQKRKEQEEIFTTKQEEVQVLGRKLEKYRQKELEIKNEYEDIRRELVKDLECRQAEIDDLQKMVDQKQVMLDYFVPREVQERVARLCKYDEQQERWALQGAETTGNRRRGFV